MSGAWKDVDLAELDSEALRYRRYRLRADYVKTKRKIVESEREVRTLHDMATCRRRDARRRADKAIVRLRRLVYLLRKITRFSNEFVNVSPKT